jgi:5-dehydro-4-deoxyglucarate dehydratase
MSDVGTGPDLPARLAEGMRRSVLSFLLPPSAERGRGGPVMAAGLDLAARLARR